MKSNLWKQRREHDGRLVSIFKNLKTECEKENLLENNSLEIGNDPESRRDGKEGGVEDPWLEDLKLTEDERTKLTELDNWALETNRDQDRQQENFQPQ